MLATTLVNELRSDNKRQQAEEKGIKAGGHAEQQKYHRNKNQQSQDQPIAQEARNRLAGHEDVCCHREVADGQPRRAGLVISRGRHARDDDFHGEEDAELLE